jgi:hypothetical protein
MDPLDMLHALAFVEAKYEEDPIMGAIYAGVPCWSAEIPIPDRPGFTACGVCLDTFAHGDRRAHYARDGLHVAICGRWEEEKRARKLAAPIERRLARQQQKQAGQRGLFEQEDREERDA